MKRLDKKTSSEDEKKIKRAGIGIFISVAVLFLIIICITQAIEMRFGKVAGTIALVIVALVLAALLYSDEIKNHFKK